MPLELQIQCALLGNMAVRSGGQLPPPQKFQRKDVHFHFIFYYLATLAPRLLYRGMCMLLLQRLENIYCVGILLVVERTIYRQ